MFRRPPRSNRTDNPVPYSPLFRSLAQREEHVYHFAPVAERQRCGSAEVVCQRLADEVQRLDVRGFFGREVEPACRLAQRAQQEGLALPPPAGHDAERCARSEEHTSELQSLMRISYAVFCLKQ